MNYSPIQLDIIRTFGSKELSEGCFVRKEKWKWFKIANITDIKYPDWKLYYKQAKWYWLHWKFYQPKFKTELDFEILWHIPHLEDVFRVAKWKAFIYAITPLRLWTYEIWFNDWYRTTYINYTPEMPLLEQSEETLTQLLNLFKPS